MILKPVPLTARPAPMPTVPAAEEIESSDRIAAFILSVLDRTMDNSWPCVTATILSSALPLIHGRSLPMTEKLGAAIRDAYAWAALSDHANEELLRAWGDIAERMGVRINQDSNGDSNTVFYPDF
jgi:hypothetical protein